MIRWVFKDLKVRKSYLYQVQVHHKSPKKEMFGQDLRVINLRKTSAHVQGY